MQLGAWGWGAEALPGSPQLPGVNCSLFKGPCQLPLRPLLKSFASLGHDGLLGHFDLAPFELVTVTANPRYTEQRLVAGLLSLCLCWSQTMAALAVGTWTHARYKRMQRVDALGSVVDLETWTAAWSVSYRLMSVAPIPHV